MQDLQSNALNFTVLFSLFLTIRSPIPFPLAIHPAADLLRVPLSRAHSFALITQGVGGRQYPTDDAFDAFGAEEPSLATADLATYCYPDDLGGAQAMRRSFYAAEMGIL